MSKKDEEESVAPELFGLSGLFLLLGFTWHVGERAADWVFRLLGGAL